MKATYSTLSGKIVASGGQGFYLKSRPSALEALGKNANWWNIIMKREVIFQYSKLPASPRPLPKALWE